MILYPNEWMKHEMTRNKKINTFRFPKHWTAKFQHFFPCFWASFWFGFCFLIFLLLSVTFNMRVVINTTIQFQLKKQFIIEQCEVRQFQQLGMNLFAHFNFYCTWNFVIHAAVINTNYSYIVVGGVVFVQLRTIVY